MRDVEHASAVSQAGFTMIPNAVMVRRDLKPTAKLVYGYLKHLAWRERDHAVAPMQDVIASDLGVSVDAIRTALRELGRAPCREGDEDGGDVLVVMKRRGQGLTARYIVNEPGEAVMADSATARNGDSLVLETGISSFPITKTLEARESVEENTNRSLQHGDDGEQPVPRLRKIDGRNLGYDALCEVCGIGEADNLARQVATALTPGKARGLRFGIRQLVWQEVRGTPHAEEEAFEIAVAALIRVQALRYHERFPGVEMTPLALAKWWAQLRKDTGRGVRETDWEAVRESASKIREWMAR